MGQTILDIYLSDNKEQIKFKLEDGQEIIARCDAECCSYTWIEDVLDPDAVIGSPVLQAFDINMPAPANAEEDPNGYIQYYGFAIETVKGRFTIAYRNESNGYYGGSLAWKNDSYFYGGVFGQNSREPSSWTSIINKNEN